jgi:hypothetical protein
MRRARGAICGASGPIGRARPHPAPRMGPLRGKTEPMPFLNFYLTFFLSLQTSSARICTQKKGGPQCAAVQSAPLRSPNHPRSARTHFCKTKPNVIPRAPAWRESAERACPEPAERSQIEPPAPQKPTPRHISSAPAQNEPRISPPVPIRCDQMQPDATCARNAISRPPILTDQPTRIALCRYEFRRRPPRLEPPHPAGVR